MASWRSISSMTCRTSPRAPRPSLATDHSRACAPLVLFVAEGHSATLRGVALFVVLRGPRHTQCSGSSLWLGFAPPRKDSHAGAPLRLRIRLSRSMPLCLDRRSDEQRSQWDRPRRGRRDCKGLAESSGCAHAAEAARSCARSCARTGRVGEAEAAAGSSTILALALPGGGGGRGRSVAGPAVLSSSCGGAGGPAGRGTGAGTAAVGGSGSGAAPAPGAPGAPGAAGAARAGGYSIRTSRCSSASGYPTPGLGRGGGGGGALSGGGIDRYAWSTLGSGPGIESMDAGLVAPDGYTMAVGGALTAPAASAPEKNASCFAIRSD
eukprot:scaffold462_cov195-Pinguiococcus_pyrenoidosus.AAC.99